MTPTMTESQMKRILALNWKTAHSVRLQKATGDDKLVCAYRGDTDRWLLARVERVRVGKVFGFRSYEEFEDVPVTWKVWQDDDGSKLEITDPRLLPYIQKCDNQTGADVRVNAAVALYDQMQDEAPRRAAADMLAHAMDRIKDFRRGADSLGLTHHRKGGHEGGRVSSNSLWRDYSAPMVTLA